MTTKKPRLARTTDSVSKESPKAPLRRKSTKKNSNHSLSDDEIARKAYELWEYRGRPVGSPEEDWFRAKNELSMNATA